MVISPHVGRSEEGRRVVRRGLKNYIQKLSLKVFLSNLPPSKFLELKVDIERNILLLPKISGSTLIYMFLFLLLDHLFIAQ